MKLLQNNAVRILVQTAALGPMILLTPFALFYGPLVIIGIILNENRFFEFLPILLGWFGLIGLYASIFVPIDRIVASTKRCRTIVTLLFAGLLATILITVPSTRDFVNAPYFPNTDHAISIWMFLGPVVVALWNLKRIRNASHRTSPSLPSTP